MAKGGAEEEKQEVDGIWKDERFAHLVKDPRFKGIPKKEKKVKIDKRFQSMFNDPKFKLKYTYDKYGRRVDNSTEDDLKKFYDIQSEEDEPKEDEEEPAVEEDAAEAKEDSAELENDTLETSSADIATKLKERLRDLETDYARGEGIILTDSSSDDESGSDGEGGVEQELFIDHAWGELATDAPMTADSSRRLAACNMDWDKMRAEDIWVLCSSFLPPSSQLVSVGIYPSEFGKERMREEEEIGPQELVTKDADDDDEGDHSSGIDDLLGDSEEDEEEEQQQRKQKTKKKKKKPAQTNKEKREGDDFHMEKLRQYQLNRLKYYYAVIECDSIATADKLYVECDGLEYESSATKLDLRFIPDEMQFEDEPREMCTEMPDLAKYAPRSFQTTALQSAKVDLTWDETTQDRKEFAEKLKDGKLSEISDLELRKYLACSSDEEEVEAQAGRGRRAKASRAIAVASGSESDESEESEEEVGGKEDSVQKYRNLLADIKAEDEKKKASKSIGMEFSWDVRAQDKVAGAGAGQDEGEGSAALTPFEKLIEKQKRKKQQRQSKKETVQDDMLEDSDGDGDVPDGIDLNDPYFAEEFASGDFAPKKSDVKKRSAKELKKQEEEDQKREQEALALLLDDEEDGGRSHFSLKKIQKAEAAEESTSKRKRKRLLKKSKEEILERKQKTEASDGFEINLDDNRFGAIYSSHLYNIDPTDPNFKKTKVMEKLITEKLKRKKIDPSAVEDGVPEEAPVKRSKKALEKVASQMLVNKLKRTLK